MAEPTACRNLKLRQYKNFSSFGEKRGMVLDLMGYSGCGKNATFPDFKKYSQAQMYLIEHYHEVDVLVLILTQCIVYYHNFELFKYNI